MSAQFVGRRPKLTPEQAAAAVARVELGKKHRLRAVAKDFGISVATLSSLVNGHGPKRWQTND